MAVVRAYRRGCVGDSGSAGHAQRGRRVRSPAALPAFSPCPAASSTVRSAVGQRIAWWGLHASRARWIGSGIARVPGAGSAMLRWMAAVLLAAAASASLAASPQAGPTFVMRGWTGPADVVSADALRDGRVPTTPVTSHMLHDLGPTARALAARAHRARRRAPRRRRAGISPAHPGQCDRVPAPRHAMDVLVGRRPGGRCATGPWPAATRPSSCRPATTSPPRSTSASGTAPRSPCPCASTTSRRTSSACRWSTWRSASRWARRRGSSASASGGHGSCTTGPTCSTPAIPSWACGPPPRPPASARTCCGAMQASGSTLRRAAWRCWARAWPASSPERSPPPLPAPRASARCCAS